jgi:hypothetical protein
MLIWGYFHLSTLYAGLRFQNARLITLYAALAVLYIESNLRYI